jgi:hypothetical protein
VKSPETTASDDLGSSVTRSGRIWLIAMIAAVLAALVAWGVEESSLHYYGSELTASKAPRDYRTDLLVRQPREPGAAPPGARPGAGGRSPYGPTRAARAYNEEYTARAIAISGGAVGAMFGLAFGLALGLTGGTTSRSWLRGGFAAVFGTVLCGAGGWFATWALVPLFYQARAENPGSPLVIASLLLIRGVPRMIAGLAGGLTLGVALGGGSRLFRGALGGMIGAALGVALVVIGDEVIALIASQPDIATSPILRSPTRRITAILAVTVPSAAGAAWAILNLRTARKPEVIDAGV